MGLQQKINSLIGQASVIASVGKHFQSKEETVSNKSKEDNSNGIDSKMAQKPRKIAMQKIKTIYNNKQWSQKAMSRRIGKVLDEYQGGKK